MVTLQPATFPSVLLTIIFLLFVTYLERTREIGQLKDKIIKIHLEKHLLEKKIAGLNSKRRRATTHVNNLDLSRLDKWRRLNGYWKVDPFMSRVPDTPRKIIALQAYYDGTGVILHHHIMHCAGTALCKLISNLPKQDGGVVRTHMPACWPKLMNNWYPMREDNLLNNGRGKWKTVENVDYISWELPIVTMPWDSNKITYITAFRHPISRMFAVDGKVDWGPFFPEVRNKAMTPHSWENFTVSSLADNWLLRHVLGIYINNSRVLTREDLERAKLRLRKFTFILITEWLPESWSVLCEMMRWTDCDHYGRIERGDCTKEELKHSYAHQKKWRHGQEESNRKMIMNDTIYADLLERNAFDIELYNYAVSLNLDQMRRHGRVNISGVLSRTMKTHFDNQKYFSPHCGIMANKCFWSTEEEVQFQSTVESMGEP